MKGSIDKGMKTNNFRNKFLQSFTNKTNANSEKYFCFVLSKDMHSKLNIEPIIHIYL